MPAFPRVLLSPRTTIILSVSGAVALTLVVVLSALLAMRTGREVEDALRSQEIRGLLSSYFNQIGFAQSGQRGFLLTGRDSYQAPYDAAIREIPPILARLDREFATDPAGHAQVAELRSVTADKLAELQETIDAARAGHPDAALALVLTDRGQRDMDRIVALAARLSERENASVVRDLLELRQGAERAVAVDVVALLGVLALAALSLIDARRSIASLRAAQEALSAANANLADANETLENTVRQRTSALTEANEEIQRFAYIVSHDLRGPLLNVMGFTGELEISLTRLQQFLLASSDVPADAVPAEVRECTEQDIPEAISFIKASTSKMDRLINAILRLSREGRRVLTPEWLDMDRLLASTVATLKHMADAGGATIQVNLLPPIISDRLAVEQIFANLLENALKYLQPGRPGQISVDGEVAGAMAVYRVQDNGRGIAPRDRKRVFELFRRAGEQTVAGEGIGLAHVSTLLRQLGGCIECSSAPTVGSTFTVRIPVVLRHREDAKP